MAVIKIASNSFAGASRLSDGDLALAIRALAQAQAKTVAGALTDLTDNSGGAAANGTIDAIPLATTAPATGDTCPTKSEVETAFGTVKDALTEIGAKIASIAAVVPAFTPTNSIGGAAADGTIAAITVAFTGATSARVAMAGFNSVVTATRLLIAELARDTNELCEACGVDKLVVTALPALTTFDKTYSALSTDTGTAAANGTTSITDAQGEATMAAIAAAVKEIATKLNVLTGASINNAVVIATASY